MKLVITVLVWIVVAILAIILPNPYSEAAFAVFLTIWVENIKKRSEKAMRIIEDVDVRGDSYGRS